MASVGGANIINNGLVTLLDVSNIKSFRGEPTTNLTINDNNFTGTNYSPNGEWTSNPTVFTKSYNNTIKTPIGVGATLLSESGVNGSHHLSRWGGSGVGNHSLSCYVYPISPSINNFTIGLLSSATGIITFNLTNRLITYGGGTIINSAFIEDVPNYPGWLRIGGNHGGRSGGWVGCIGLSLDTTYTGVFGERAFYITGIQYENTSTPTFFTPAGTTRGTTVTTGCGLFDISNNTRHGTLFGTTYDKNNQGVLDFDGTDDYFTIPQPNVTLTPNRWTISLWLKPGNQGSRFLTPQSNGIDQFLLYDNTNQRVQIAIATSADVNERTRGMGGNTAPRDRWTHISISLDDKVIKMYSNGVLTNTYTETLDIANWSGTWVIGQRGNSTFWFLGSISNLMVHNRVLSDDEILQNYNATKSRFNL